MSELRVAESAAVSQLGEEHPEVSLIRMDLALALAGSTSGTADDEVRSMVASARAALRSSFPAAHPRMTFLDSLGVSPEESSPSSDAAFRKRLLDSKGLQFNDWL